MAWLKGCDPCIGKSVAFINHGRNKKHDVFSPWYRVYQGLSFVLPFVTPAPVVRASLTLCYSYQSRLRKGVHTRPRGTVGNTYYYYYYLLLSCPTCVPTLTNSSFRACCPNQLLYYLYWARCEVCHPVQYRPQVVCTVREYFASLSIEHTSIAVAKPSYTLASRRPWLPEIWPVFPE